MRRAIVGVLGGDDQHGQARAVGQMIVRNGWILLTGGDGTSKAKKPQVKDTSMCGAASLNGPRIGILPDNTPLPSSATPRIAKWDQPSRANYLFLKTGVSSKERNVINGQTPDILIAFSGGRGTLAEIAFAVAAKKPVLFVAGSVQKLEEKIDKHFGQRNPKRGQYLNDFFEKPLSLYPKALGKGSGQTLLDQLSRKLKDSKEVNIEAIEKAIIYELRRGIGQQANFPGVPVGIGSRCKFERGVKNISAQTRLVRSCQQAKVRSLRRPRATIRGVG